MYFPSGQTNLDDVDRPAVDVGLVLLGVALTRLDARDHLVTSLHISIRWSLIHGHIWSQPSPHLEVDRFHTIGNFELGFFVHVCEI